MRVCTNNIVEQANNQTHEHDASTGKYEHAELVVSRTRTHGPPTATRSVGGEIGNDADMSVVSYRLAPHLRAKRSTYLHHVNWVDKCNSDHSG
jgi:hypothetical protein